MATFTGTNKNAVTFTNTSKNSATLSGSTKAGQGWQYDQVQITYDGTLDPATSLTIYYDSLGVASSFTNLPKS